MAALVPTCVWRATAELVVALDKRFGEPIDAYVNGSQVWLRRTGGPRHHRVAAPPRRRLLRRPGLSNGRCSPAVALALARGDVRPPP